MDGQTVRISLGALQLIALFLPVVILTTKFMLNQLSVENLDSPDEAEVEMLNKHTTRVLFGSLSILVLSSVSAILLLFVLICTLNIPSLTSIGLLLIVGAFTIFTIIMGGVIVEWVRLKRQSIPS